MPRLRSYFRRRRPTYTRLGFNRRLGFQRLRPGQRRRFSRVLPHNLRVTGGSSTSGIGQNAKRMFLDSCHAATVATAAAAGNNITELASALTHAGGDLANVGDASNTTGLLSMAVQYGRYLVTGWKYWYRFSNTAASSANNGPLYFLWIPRHKFNNTAYAALADETARWRYLMCHPYAKKVLVPSGNLSQTKEAAFYIDRATSNALDKFDDLRDDVSGSAYSGTLTVDYSGAGDPTVTDTAPSSEASATTVPEAEDNTRATLNTTPFRLFLVTGVPQGARPEIHVQVRLRKYVLFYDPVLGSNQPYSYAQG